MREMKIIVVGATGYVGESLLKKARAVGSVIGTSSSGGNDLIPLRLEAADEFNYEIIEPGDVVLLTAAISAPDVCAREHDRAWATNVVGTTLFIGRVLAKGARVIFFSSDTVYGEKDIGFDESANCLPAGEYAAMKFAVENKFNKHPGFKAIRLSYIFSFADKFTRFLFSCAARQEEADLFHPFYRAIIHRDDVVDGVLALAVRWHEFPSQVINFGGPEVLSRIDFANCLQRNGLAALRFRVTQPGDDFFKNRPRAIAMVSGILPKLLGRSVHTLDQAIHIEFNRGSVL